MKALVTGGCGFIGSHVVDALVEQGHEVLVLDNLDPQVHTGQPDYINRGAEYIFADLRHWVPDGRVDDVEAILHFAAVGGVGRAAKQPADLVSTNVAGWVRLLEFARDWKALQRVVLASSFSVYGANYSYVCSNGHLNGAERNEQNMQASRFEVYCSQCGQACNVLPITIAATPQPLELYGASKYMQELSLRGFTSAPSTILRFSSVYGTRLRLNDGEATIIAKLAGWVREKASPVLFEDGQQIRDWVYTGDIVAAALAVLAKPQAPSLVNVCSGLPVTLIQATEILAEIYGNQVTPTIAGGYRFGDMRHCLGDPAELASLIGRQPLSFVEGAAKVFSKE